MKAKRSIQFELLARVLSRTFKHGIWPANGVNRDEAAKGWAEVDMLRATLNVLKSTYPKDAPICPTCDFPYPYKMEGFCPACD